MNYLRPPNSLVYWEEKLEPFLGVEPVCILLQEQYMEELLVELEGNYMWIS